MSIVVIGSSFVDIKGYPLGKFIPNGRNHGTIETVHGGVARNVVEDIANLELRPMFVSLVDDSGLGQEVKEKLERHKVDTRYIRTVKDGMGTWLAVFDDHGDVAASMSKRPDLSPIGEILDEKGDEIFEQADCVLFELDLEKAQVKQILALAQRHHRPAYALISNMTIALERRDLLKQLDCFVCNLQEAGQLFAMDLEDRTPEEMAPLLLTKIRQAGIRRMVVTMGGRGAVYAEAEGGRGAVYAEAEGGCGICPARKVPVIDTTGAGDSFFAGVAAGLNGGKSLAEACEIGCSLSASVISTLDNVCPRFEPAEFGLSR